jgi:hypothetical protein
MNPNGIFYATDVADDALTLAYVPSDQPQDIAILVSCEDLYRYFQCSHRGGCLARTVNLTVQGSERPGISERRHFYITRLSEITLTWMLLLFTDI